MEWFAAVQPSSGVPFIALRLSVAAIFVAHGWPKMTSPGALAAAFGNPKMKAFLLFLGIAEMAGAIALVLGFVTALAATGLSLVMVFAIILKLTTVKTPFAAHDKMGWEFDLIILAGTVALFFWGAGQLAIDPLFFTPKDL